MISRTKKHARRIKEDMEPQIHANGRGFQKKMVCDAHPTWLTTGHLFMQNIPLPSGRPWWYNSPIMGWERLV